MADLALCLIDVPRNIQVGDVPEHIKPIVKPDRKTNRTFRIKISGSKSVIGASEKTRALCWWWRRYGKRNASGQKIPTNYQNAVCFDIERFRLN